MSLSTRRDFVRAMAALAATRPPNIVYILADDLGWGDLNCYNPQSAVPTPNGAKIEQPWPNARQNGQGGVG